MSVDDFKQHDVGESTSSVKDFRLLIIQLSTIFARGIDVRSNSLPSRQCILGVISILFHMASACSTLLGPCIRAKMAVNNLKYDRKMCLRDNDRIRKYKDYSVCTGIGSDNDLAIHFPVSVGVDWITQVHAFIADYVSLSTLVTDFAEERNWLPYYSPQSLIVSLFCEIGELSEVLQWEDPEKMFSRLDALQIRALLREVADIAVYCLHCLREINACGSCRVHS